jgi:putative transposase
VRFAWIDQNKEHFEIQMVCRILQVSRSGFYAWRDRPCGPRQRRRDQLVSQIRQAHADSRGIYGSPRVHAQMAAQGTAVCRNTVCKYMRQEGLCSKMKRRFRVRTTDTRHDHPIAGNRLDRDFAARTPDAKWCCDITCIVTDEGWLYLAAVIDCCSRKIVGWSMAEHMRADLCLNALEMALQRRSPRRGLLHHSDRGVQYACDAYRQMLKTHGLEASMSRSGNCYDNAMMESFWGTLKSELVYHEHYQTHAQARESIFEYIEVFYNRRRCHSAIGYTSPESFEARLN